jgi:hypothetical protein
MSVAIIADLHALDQFHHEIRPSAFGGAGIEDVSDVRMIHQCQGLSLSRKACHHAFRVHSWLDDLKCDAAADRLLLLSHENDATSSFADLLHQFVAADSISRLLASGSSRPASHRHFRWRSFEKTPGLIVSQQ